MIRILIAEDHIMVRDGLASILNAEPDLTVVAEAENGQEAIAYYSQHQPDITLMDLRMPQLDGVGAIAQIREQYPNARIIILTTYDGDEDIYRGLQAGAMGYLLKDVPADELITAIHAVNEGRKYVLPQVAMKLTQRLNSSTLTDREAAVLQRLAQGRSNQAISNDLAITEGTVKFHVNNILHKLGVSDRTQAVIMGIKRGLVHLD